MMIEREPKKFAPIVVAVLGILAAVSGFFEARIVTAIFGAAFIIIGPLCILATFNNSFDPRCWFIEAHAYRIYVQATKTELREWCGEQLRGGWKVDGYGGNDTWVTLLHQEDAALFRMFFHDRIIHVGAPLPTLYDMVGEIWGNLRR